MQKGKYRRYRHYNLTIEASKDAIDLVPADDNLGAFLDDLGVRDTGISGVRIDGVLAVPSGPAPEPPPIDSP